MFCVGLASWPPLVSPRLHLRTSSPVLSLPLDPSLSLSLALSRSKSPNVLLTGDGTAKLADVGFSREKLNTFLTDAGAVVGTWAWWVAPRCVTHTWLGASKIGVAGQPLPRLWVASRSRPGPGSALTAAATPRPPSFLPLSPAAGLRLSCCWARTSAPLRLMCTAPASCCGSSSPVGGWGLVKGGVEAGGGDCDVRPQGPRSTSVTAGSSRRRLAGHTPCPRPPCLLPQASAPSAASCGRRACLKSARRRLRT